MFLPTQESMGSPSLELQIASQSSRGKREFEKFREPKYQQTQQIQLFMKRKRTSSLVTDPPTSLQQTPNGEHKLQTFPSELIRAVMDYIPEYKEEEEQVDDEDEETVESTTVNAAVTTTVISPIVSFGVTCQAFYKVFQNHPRSFYFQFRNRLPGLIDYHHQNATAYVKSLKKLIKKHENQLFLQSELEKKREEWNKWMNKSDRGRGIDIDMKRLNQTVKQLIWDKVFQKVSYSYIKMSRADYHCNYNATVEIEGLVITHWSYDDQGCSTQWNISVQSKAQKDIKRVLNFEDDLLSYSRNALQFIRSRLELDECKLTDPELLKIVVFALPWKWGRNCVFMSDAMEAYDELP